MITSLETCVPHIIERAESVDEFSNAIGISQDVLIQLNPHILGLDRLRPGIPMNLPFECAAGLEHGTPAVEGGPHFPVHWAMREWEASLDTYQGPIGPNSALEKYHASTGGVRPDDVSWCSSFVNWCVEQAGLRGTDNSAARSWENWSEPASKPERGDIVVLARKDEPWRGHVGFFWADAGRFVELLGAGHGGMVHVSHYPKNGKIYQVAGYRRVPESDEGSRRDRIN